MPKTIVISGSASLNTHMKVWAAFWKENGLKVLKYPTRIPKREILKRWTGVHTGFYCALEKTDIHFIANENHKNQKGYIGNGTFAEIAFSMGLNLVRKKKVEIILYQKPSRTNQFSEDIDRWQKMGWLRYMSSK